MASPYPFLVRSPKELLIGVEWSKPDIDGRLEFLAPLAIGGVTVGGLGFRGTCSQERPNENVMFQLEAGTPGVRTRKALVRLEWRPLSEPHKNPARLNDEQSDLLIWGTHVHHFDLNWLEQEDRLMTGNLPYAVEIVPDFETYESLVDFAKTLFKINGLENIEKPLWSEKLI